MSLLSEIATGTRSASMKRQIINHYLYEHSSTLPDLAKELKVSVPTVTKFIGEMTEKGYIISYGKQETNEGRPPTLYGLNPKSGYFIGVDLKQSSMNLAVMNFVGEIFESRMGIPCQLENTPDGLERVCLEILAFIDQLNIEKDRILNIGINISGRVNPDSGYSYSWFNFEERPLADVLSERMNYPVSIDNDSRAMTYGEMTQGVVKGEKDVIFINLSWGLGCGLIFNGELYKGKSGFSGEFGHFSVFDNEKICNCGKKGCLETEVSGIALHNNLLNAVQQEGKESILSEKIKENPDSVTLRDIIDATNKEDFLCIELIEDIGQKLGRFLASLINLLNPELVVIGGELAQTEDYILQPIRGAVRKYSLNLVNKDTAVVLSKLQERAGIVGACMLARYKMFKGSTN